MTGLSPQDAAHAPLAPSSAHIWLYCSASVGMQASYPEPETEDSLQGTAAHWYVSEYLNGRDVPIGSVDPNGIPITAEMIDCAQGILIDIRDTYAAAGPESSFFVEQRVYSALVHEQNWGTPDAQLTDHVNKTIHLWDYKFGHRFVDARENKQMIDYAIGAMNGIPSADWPHWKVTLNIAQPRNYHEMGPLREWRLDGKTLLDHWVPIYYEAAKKAMGPNPELVTGEYCRDCSARHACPALQQAAAYSIDVSLQEAPIDLPAHALGLELRHIDDAIKRLKARQTGLEEQALSAIRGGTTIPFFTAKHSTGRLAWEVPAEQVFALGDLFGVELRKDREPITPTQAINAGIDTATVNEMADRPRGAVRLERADDDAARLAFQQ